MGPEEFLEELWGDAPGAGREIAVWNPANKHAVWCRSAREAGAAARALSDSGVDVYSTVALHDPARALECARRDNPGAEQENARGSAESALALAGFWADVDVEAPHHRKKGLAKSVDALQARLGGLPAQPSVVVDTGGGLHFWWLFREPLEIETPLERERIPRVLGGWHAFLKRHFECTVDPTADLARVMRVAGTRNQRALAEARVVARSEVRYNASDFDSWELSASSRVTRDEVAVFGGVVVAEGRPPPWRKIVALCGLDQRFNATWARKREDLPSQSEHDMSLAALAARAGFTDQEIVDTVIEHRRAGGHDPKLRPDYYRLLCSKARRETEHEGEVQAAHERLEVHAIEAADPAPAPAGPAPAAADPGGDAPAAGGRRTPVDRDLLVKDLSKALGLPIVRIVRFVGDPPTYRLDLPEQSVSLPRVETILSAERFRAAVAAASGKVLRPYKRGTWDPIAQAILRACVDEDLGPDSNPAELALEWLAHFLAEHPPAPEESKQKAFRARRPWIQGSDLWFWLSELVDWIRVRGGGDKIGRRLVATGLRTAGAMPQPIRLRGDNGRPSTVNCWRVSLGILPRTLSAREPGDDDDVPIDSPDGPPGGSAIAK